MAAVHRLAFALAVDRYYILDQNNIALGIECYCHWCVVSAQWKAARRALRGLPLAYVRWRWYGRGRDYN